MKHLSPKQVAQAIGVSESSLKRWCDQGVLASSRTVGGHRRVALNEVLQFLRRSGNVAVRPDVLGLPSNTGQGQAVIERAAGRLERALVEGEEEQCRRIVFDLYLAGRTACDICDKVVAPAFHAIGEAWGCGEVAVYQERRACEIALRVLYELRAMLPVVERHAPRAMGGTLRGDPYRLATISAEIALREAGWQAESFGCGLPADTLCAAIRQVRPQLVWLSVSHVPDADRLIDDCAAIHQITMDCASALALGGRAMSAEMRSSVRCSACCSNLRDLVTFAATLPHSNGRHA